MSIVKELREVEIKKARTISAKLRNKINAADLSFADEEVTDLVDIYEICSIYIKLIDHLVLETTPDEEVAEILRNINNDLYIHLSYHCKNLKKPLQQALDTLNGRLD